MAPPNRRENAWLSYGAVCPIYTNMRIENSTLRSTRCPSDRWTLATSKCEKLPLTRSSCDKQLIVTDCHFRTALSSNPNVAACTVSVDYTFRNNSPISKCRGSSPSVFFELRCLHIILQACGETPKTARKWWMLVLFASAAAHGHIISATLLKRSAMVASSTAVIAQADDYCNYKKRRDIGVESNIIQYLITELIENSAI